MDFGVVTTWTDDVTDGQTQSELCLPDAGAFVILCCVTFEDNTTPRWLGGPAGTGWVSETDWIADITLASGAFDSDEQSSTRLSAVGGIVPQNPEPGIFDFEFFGTTTKVMGYVVQIPNVKDYVQRTEQLQTTPGDELSGAFLAEPKGLVGIILHMSDDPGSECFVPEPGFELFDSFGGLPLLDWRIGGAYSVEPVDPVSIQSTDETENLGGFIFEVQLKEAGGALSLTEITQILG